MQNADSSAAPPWFFFTMVLVTVICEVDNQVRIVERNLIEKSDVNQFTIRRLANIQNTAAHQVMSTLAPEEQKSFRVIEVIIGNMMPLGYMTADDFWAGTTDLVEKIEAAEAAETTVAVPATPVPDNVVSLVQPAKDGDTNEA